MESAADQLHPQPAGQILADVGSDAEAFGHFAGRPLLTVRVDEDPALPVLAARLRHSPCVSVGVADAHQLGRMAGVAPPDLDVLLTEAKDPPAPWVGCPDPGATVTELARSIGASPAPAIALVQLLRFAPSLDIADALVAESFVYSMLQAGACHRTWLAERKVVPRREVRASSAVVLTRRDGILLIELHRPEVRNAVNAQMRDELATAFQLAATDGTIEQVLLAGGGQTFCSGGDLAEFGTADDPAVAHVVRTTRGVVLSMLEAAARTTCVVQGACVGAGVEFAAAAGKVVAYPDACFSLPELEMGLVPGAGGTATIPRRIGRQRTAFFALSGQSIDARAAAAWGLVDTLATPPKAAEPHC